MAKKSAARSKGYGTLEKHGRVYRMRWKINGKVVVKSTGTGDRRKAERILEDENQLMRLAKNDEFYCHLEARKKSNADEIKALQRQQIPTFDVLWLRFEQIERNRRCDPSTLRNYEQWYFLFVQWLRLRHSEIDQMTDVTQQIVQEYGAYLNAGTTPEMHREIMDARMFLKEHPYVDDDSPLLPRWKRSKLIAAVKFRRAVRGTTYNRHMNALSLFWRTMIYSMPGCENLTNPFAWDKEMNRGVQRVRLAKGERAHPHSDLTVEEVSRLLKMTNGEMRALIALGYFTGLRLKDCVLMDWGDVDFVTQVITNTSYKTDTKTVRVIHPGLMHVLSVELNSEHMGYLMPGLANLYQSPGGRTKINKKIKDAFKAAGINTSFQDGSGRRSRADKSFHSLRHTFNTQLEQAGISRTMRMELMGHATEQMTAYYERPQAYAALALPNVIECADSRVSEVEGSVPARISA